jgi:pimeloyl-ACP methyl ester carboxylesterase
VVDVRRPGDNSGSPLTLLSVDGYWVGVWRFGSPNGWPLLWHHGGLSCGLNAKMMDDAGRRCGADIISIDRPGIGHSQVRNVSSIAGWPQTVEHVANLLHLNDFAVVGWSGGGPYALACAAALPNRVRAVATVAGMAPLERLGHVLELGLWADRLLISIAHVAPRVAAALLWSARWVPDRYLGWELARGAVGSTDRAALETALPTLLAVAREATRGGVSGMVDEYRRYYGLWGFDLGEVRQPVTLWQGEKDTWLPMNHARRLESMLPNRTFKLIPSTGHLAPLVIADEILKDLAP